MYDMCYIGLLALWNNSSFHKKNHGVLSSPKLYNFGVNVNKTWRTSKSKTNKDRASGVVSNERMDKKL